ncbi:hypothetical protein BHM03_00015535 [Ensete ventricosum]|uniref:Pectate lyase n=1 Tax=Ensete ventricosum TaxID=4639 RepID=A0A445MEF3_ENSVE|nr:hypothetical protein BHM03_00015535 [Ensete ventricosum]
MKLTSNYCRIRHGYAHLANNLYDGWGEYAIGGTMNPSVRSEGNLFIASGSSNKKVTLRMVGEGGGTSWNWQSVNDAFLNGAFFRQAGSPVAAPRYNRRQRFTVARPAAVLARVDMDPIRRWPGLRWQSGDQAATAVEIVLTTAV